jgi:hypothetical protein
MASPLSVIKTIEQLYASMTIWMEIMELRVEELENIEKNQKKEKKSK